MNNTIMKPAIFINDFHKGGAERLVKDLAAEMVKKSNVDPVVIVAREEGELQSEFELEKFPTYSLDVAVTSSSIPKAIRKLSGTLSDLDIDLVHSHLPFSHIVSRLACTQQRIPNVSTYHNVQEHKTLPKRLAERTTRPLTDRIVCVSDGVRQSYPNSTNMDVIYNAINVSEFKKTVSESDPPKLADEAANASTVFLNVARCVKQKRQEDLIEAINLMDTDDIHLFIVGDGPCRKMLENLVSEKGLQKTVTITGYVENVEPYYGIADVFVSSSLNEGLPTTHIEAMAAQLPVVSTDIPGVTEIVEPGVNGYLSPPNTPSQLSSNMIDVIPHQDAFGKNGYDMAKETFSIDSVADMHLKLYDSIIKR